MILNMKIENVARFITITQIIDYLGALNSNSGILSIQTFRATGLLV